MFTVNEFCEGLTFTKHLINCLMTKFEYFLTRRGDLYRFTKKAYVGDMWSVTLGCWLHGAERRFPLPATVWTSICRDAARKQFTKAFRKNVITLPWYRY